MIILMGSMSAKQQGEISGAGNTSLGGNEVKSILGQDLVQFEELSSQGTEIPTGQGPIMAAICYLGVSTGWRVLDIGWVSLDNFREDLAPPIQQLQRKQKVNFRVCEGKSSKTLVLRALLKPPLWLWFPLLRPQGRKWKVWVSNYLNTSLWFEQFWLSCGHQATWEIALALCRGGPVRTNILSKWNLMHFPEVV